MIEVEPTKTDTTPSLVEYRIKQCEETAASTATIATEEELIHFRPENILAEDQGSRKVFSILAEIATRGVLRYKWKHVRWLISKLLELRLNEFKQSITVDFPQDTEHSMSETKKVDCLQFARDTICLQARVELFRLLRSFDDYPFTVQRICELLILAHEYYKSHEKLVWALEKCLTVTETVKHLSACPALPTVGELELEVSRLQIQLVASSKQSSQKSQGEVPKERPISLQHQQQEQPSSSKDALSEDPETNSLPTTSPPDQNQNQNHPADSSLSEEKVNGKSKAGGATFTTSNPIVYKSNMSDTNEGAEQMTHEDTLPYNGGGNGGTLQPLHKPLEIVTTDATVRNASFLETNTVHMLESPQKKHKVNS